METKETTPRQDYLNGSLSFEQFYRMVNETANYRVTDAGLINECRAALAAEDYHLNTIPLARWDAMATFAPDTLKRAFTPHGDYATLAGLVCAIKQAARDAAHESHAA